MKRIMIDNINLDKEQAIKEALKYYAQTRQPVAVENAVGDTVLYIVNGKKHWYC